MTSTLTNYNTVSANSNQITVTISNPCASTTITDTQTIPQLTTTVKGTAGTHTFTAYTDSVSTTTNTNGFGANNCGVPTYTITMSDGTTAVPGYLTLSGTTLTLSTTDAQYIGTHNIKLHVTLTEFSITHTEDFSVVINECVPVIPAPTLTAQTYTVNDSAVTYTHAAFTDSTVCGFTFTYTAFLVVGATETALPTAYASYNAGTRTFTISSSNVNDAGTYTIKVYGTLNNTPSTANSGTFTITINDGCNADTVSLTTAIGAQNYIIQSPVNAVTYQATFTQT